MAEFKSFWFGEAPSAYQRLAMQSFLDHGHRYALYAYQTFDTPAGVELRDAGEILPRDRVFFYDDLHGKHRGSVSGFSNLFRYALLHRLGGWWVDADMVCLSATVPDDEIFVSWEYDHLVGTAILKFPAGHPFVKKLCDGAEAAGTDIPWGTTGPRLLTDLVLQSELLRIAKPHQFGYPVSSVDALHLLMPERCAEVEERTAGKPFLHFWNEVLRRAAVFQWMAPPEGSFMDKLFARHRIGFRDAPRYSGETILRLSHNYRAALTPFAQGVADKAEITRLQDRLERTRATAEAATRELAHLRGRVQGFETSTSWRLTAPFRRLVDVVRRALK